MATKLTFQIIKLCRLIPVLILCFALTLKAQVSASFEKQELIDFVNQYKALFNLINHEVKGEQLEVYRKLFSESGGPMINDYCDAGTPEFNTGRDYFNDLVAFFADSNTVVQNLRITVSRHYETFYCKTGSDYYVWMSKRFEYKLDTRRKDILLWVRLIIRRNNYGALKIVKIVESEKPEDDDQDLVPNRYDNCSYITQNKQTDLRGCEIKEPEKPTWEDTPVIKATRRDTPIYTPPIRSRYIRIHNPPTPPSSRFSIELTGGGMVPLKTAFNNRELLNYSTNTWQDSGSMAKPYGYTGGLSVHLCIHKWFGIAGGYQYFQLPFDNKRLMLQIKNYLGNNGVNYNDVSVVSDAYRFHMAYAALSIGFGTFKNHKTIVKIEPLIGQVFSDIVWENKLDIRIAYKNGEQQRQSMLLKTDPFLVKGGKATIQFGFGEEGTVRFQITGYYIEGKSIDPSHTFTFNNLPGKFVIPAPDLKLAGVTAGFHFTLNNPQDD